MTQPDESDSTPSLAVSLNASQLSALLALAASDPPAPTSLAAVARDRTNLEILIDELQGQPTESAANMLNRIADATTPLTALREIKDLAKRLIRDADTPMRRAAATVLYHATIAAGLANYRENISAITAEARMGLYEELARALELDPLGEVFRRALE